MPVLCLIAACALWALSFPLVKALHLEQSARLAGASSVFLAAWMQIVRFGLGALLLLPFAFRIKRPCKTEIRQACLLAFWGGAGMWFQADALAYADASTAAFLTQAYCIILPLWTCIRLKTLPKRRVIVATLMVIAGSAILSGMKPDKLSMGRGEIETLCAAALFTFQILTLENPRYAGNCGIRVSFVMFLAVALLFIPVTLLTAPNFGAIVAAGASGPALVLIISLALFCSVGAYLLMNIFQPRVPATEAGLIYTTEPVFTSGYVLFLPALLGTYIGLSYPNEILSRELLLGGSLVFAANLLMQWKTAPHMPPLATTPDPE